MMEINRIVWIDNLRFFLIVLVVLGHTVQYTHTGYGETLVFRYIYSFHMPLFIFVSGIVCGLKDQLFLGGASLLLKRFLQLIIPFTVYNLIFSLLVGDITAFVYYFVNPAKRLWFLWVLFFVTVFHHAGLYMGVKTKCPKWIAHIIIGIGLFAISSKFRDFCIPDIAKFYVFYVTACYMAPLIVKIKRGTTLLTVSIFVLLAFVIMGYWCDYPYPIHMPFTIIEMGSGFSKSYKMFVAFWGIMTFVLTFRQFADKPIRFLTSVGAKDTLGIYAIHMVLLITISFKTVLNPYQIQENMLAYWLGTVVVTFIMICLSECIILLLRKNNILSLLMLGENHLIRKS